MAKNKEGLGSTGFRVWGFWVGLGSIGFRVWGFRVYRV